MKLLADTHLLIWYLSGSAELSEHARSLILNGEHDIFFSAASVWEVAIKFSRGKDDFSLEPGPFRGTLLGLGFLELPITSGSCRCSREASVSARGPLRPPPRCPGDRRRVDACDRG